MLNFVFLGGRNRRLLQVITSVMGSYILNMAA